jgi:hypothetical protein
MRQSLQKWEVVLVTNAERAANYKMWQEGIRDVEASGLPSLPGFWEIFKKKRVNVGGCFALPLRWWGLHRKRLCVAGQFLLTGRGCSPTSTWPGSRSMRLGKPFWKTWCDVVHPHRHHLWRSRTCPCRGRGLGLSNQGPVLGAHDGVMFSIRSSDRSRRC